MSAAQFKIDLRREWADKQEEIGNVVEDIALTALSGIVIKSPVDTGRFRGNWTVSIGSPSSLSTTNTDKGGSATIQKGQTVIARYSEMDGFPNVWLQNNLPYAAPLEHGHSKQAPNGMVALTVAEIQSLYSTVNL